MHHLSITRLTSTELDATRGTDQCVLDRRTYLYLGERKGIRVYLGADKRTIMGLLEDGTGGQCAAIQVQPGEEWIFRDRGQWALRHTAYAVEQAFSRVSVRT